jgi:hypothetical protein
MPGMWGALFGAVAAAHQPKQGDMTLAEAMGYPPHDEPEITVSQIGDSHVISINGQDVHACEVREDAERIAERLSACAMEPVPVDLSDMVTDFTTDNLLVKATTRYSAGFIDPRLQNAIFGSTGL